LVEKYYDNNNSKIMYKLKFKNISLNLETMELIKK
ncbi:unnamed protein product, partial [marine sediment metagenome]